ncbi:MAG TPA: alpha/beta hydrolase [Candidatus Acidoferrales bacterium]|nr:alpha/beta hydrolase [Candidatus Acidoferrales bacterium]
MPWVFLLVSLVGAWLTYNVYQPIYAPPRRAAISFFAGWLTGELALHHIAWQALATLLFIRAGALHAWPGTLGLLVTLASWVGLWRGYQRSRDAETVMERALCAALGSDYRDHILPELRTRIASTIDWKPILLPFPMRHPDVERIRDVVYTRVAGLNLKLDIYRHRSHPAGCPTLLQIHGGGWVIGTKNEQGIPLMLHLAARGWVCVTADYRLSPHATFPDHLIDLKRAVQWVREHGAEYGANPDFLVLTGGSAGGHLAALLALTANDPEYQPGFETVDTAVQGCVPFYGVYDFTNHHGFWHHDALAELLERQIMKGSLVEAPDAYAKASPLHRITTAAPPFLVVHGDHDTLAPVEEARRFCEILRQTARPPIAYAEIPGAQHAFELFPSLRTTFVIRGVEHFLAYLYSQYLVERRATVASERTVAAS